MRIPTTLLRCAAATAFTAALLLTACPGENATPGEGDTADTQGSGGTALGLTIAAVDGYGDMNVPEANPFTEAKAALGHQLFFDKRLSGDGKLACYSCHLNEKGLTDARPTAIGAFEKKLSRNSPTLWNIGFHQRWYWDGRATTLEAQAAAAWKGGNMGAKATVADVVATVNGIAAYQEQFKAVFGGEATVETIPQALATYMRTIVSTKTPYDRFKAGDSTALTEAQQRGFKVFEKADCATCHSGALFTDLQFHNIGVSLEKGDVGHFKVTKQASHTAAFKTPTLRDIGDSGPYFHDGSVASLEEAVKIMATGGNANPNLDKAMKDQELTADELKDLVDFLRGGLDEPATLAEPTVPN